jgi:hypothetical protein
MLMRRKPVKHSALAVKNRRARDFGFAPGWKTSQLGPQVWQRS